MSREYEQFVNNMHADIAERFARGGDGIKRHAECRITDKIYIYLYEGGALVQTQTIDIPQNWMRRWPSDAQVRFYIRGRVALGQARITALEA